MRCHDRKAGTYRSREVQCSTFWNFEVGPIRRNRGSTRCGWPQRECYDLSAGPTEPTTGVVIVMIAALGERPYLVVLSSQAIISDYT